MTVSDFSNRSLEVNLTQVLIVIMIFDIDHSLTHVVKVLVMMIIMTMMMMMITH